MKSISILVILMFIVSAGTNAQINNQSVNDILIYTKSENGIRQYIHSAEQQQVFTLPGDKCSRISYDGIYVATVSLQDENIVIRRLADLMIVANITWDSAWELCDIGWRGSVFSLPITGTTDQYFEYDVV
ncbi:hypothetical protein HC928_17550, partial [bacterium]|nr:hypothetical protein [bacterium]